MRDVQSAQYYLLPDLLQNTYIDPRLSAERLLRRQLRARVLRHGERRSLHFLYISVQWVCRDCHQLHVLPEYLHESLQILRYGQRSLRVFLPIRLLPGHQWQQLRVHKMHEQLSDVCFGHQLYDLQQRLFVLYKHLSEFLPSGIFC